MRLLIFLLLLTELVYAKPRPIRKHTIIPYVADSSIKNETLIKCLEWVRTFYAEKAQVKLRYRTPIQITEECDEGLRDVSNGNSKVHFRHKCLRQKYRIKNIRYIKIVYIRPYLKGDIKRTIGKADICNDAVLFSSIAFAEPEKPGWCQAYTAHEIGHALGSRHDNGSGNNIMYKYLGTPVYNGLENATISDLSLLGMKRCRRFRYRTIQLPKWRKKNASYR